MTEAALNGAAVELPLPASAKALMCFQIGREPEAPEDPDRTVFLIRTPTEQLNSAIALDSATSGIVRVTGQHLRDAILLGLEEGHEKGLIEDEDYQRYCVVYDEYLALDPWDPDDGKPPRARVLLEARWRTLQDYIAEISPRYQSLIRRSILNGILDKGVVCAHVLAGWRQRDGLCVLEHGKATPETIAQLTELERIAIADFYQRAGVLSAEQKKTSDLPSGSPSSPSASPSAPTALLTGRRGKSGRTSTNETPGT